MKFYTSAVVALLLVASVSETQAIRLACPPSEKGAENSADDSEAIKGIKKAMDKFVAKHEEISTRQLNRKRIEDKLNEAEEKEEKGKLSKKEKDSAKDVAKEIEHAADKKEKTEQ